MNISKLINRFPQGTLRKDEEGMKVISVNGSTVGFIFRHQERDYLTDRNETTNYEVAFRSCPGVTGMENEDDRYFDVRDFKSAAATLSAATAYARKIIGNR